MKSVQMAVLILRNTSTVEEIKVSGGRDGAPSLAICETSSVLKLSWHSSALVGFLGL